MKPKTPPAETQLTGVLTGVWPEEARAFAADPTAALTITRSDVLEYLKGHPAAAEKYLKRCEAANPAADINKLWAEGGVYKVAWMTFAGQPAVIREFRDLNDAVVEYVHRQAGLAG